MKIQGFIFDLDGVLVDTAKYHYLAWKKLANILGIEFTKQHNEQLKGVSRMTSLNILLEIGNIKLTDEEKKQYANQKNNWYREFILKMNPSEILPGVIDFLKKTKEKNIKIALGSASKNAQTILKQLHITQYFDSIIDGTNVIKAKPNPEVFLKGAEALKIKPNECIVFEDAVAGIKAAKNANMYAIGVGNPEILKEADRVINGFINLTPDQVLSDNA